MIDSKAFETELHQARQARMEAEAANTDVEEMIWEVQQLPRRQDASPISSLVDQDS